MIGPIIFKCVELPIKKLKTFFSKQKEIHTAILFGSFAKNRIRSSSDIDFALLWDKKYLVSWTRQVNLSLTLEDICRREVDIVILNSASPHLAFRAIHEGKILFQRNRSFWNEFVVKIIRMNEDMEILYRKTAHG